MDFHHLCGLGVQNRWKYGRLPREVKSTSASRHIETDLLRATLRYQYQHLAGIFMWNCRKKCWVAGFATCNFSPILKTSYKSMGGYRAMPASLPFPILWNFLQKPPEGEKLYFSSSNSAFVRGQPRKPKTLDGSPLDILWHCQLS